MVMGLAASNAADAAEKAESGTHAEKKE